MTALAVGAKLTAMDVGVAIGAVGTHVLEDQVGVAPGAANSLVHAAQRIPGLIVIEFGIGADRRPTGIRVAVLAGRRDGTVRIRDFGLRTSDAGMRIARRLLPDSNRKQGHESNRDRSEPARTSHRTLRLMQGPANRGNLELPPIAYATSIPTEDARSAGNGIPIPRKRE